MNEVVKKRPGSLKKILISVLVLIIISVSIYWYVSREKFTDTSKRKSAYTVKALDFIKEFLQNDSLANKKYADKIITVIGTVSGIESADTTINIKFTDTTNGSYAIFAFQEQHLDEAKTLKAGDNVSIKGSCSGSIFSDILGTEVITFKRCALTK
jgi:hypothetical protein